MTFVPEFRQTAPGDPWAHRKGEPRVLTLFWAVYLMAGALMTIFAVRSLAAPRYDQYRYGCEAMLIITALGLSVLWPAVRASQTPPFRPNRAAAMDLFALAIPAQAVIWPMPLLTRWPFSTVGALALLVSAWAVLAAPLVVLGSSARSHVGRTLPVLVAIALVGLVPALEVWGVIGAAPGETPWWRLLSPLTGVKALTASPGNVSPHPEAWEWGLALAPALVGAAFWGAVAATRRLD